MTQNKEDLEFMTARLIKEYEEWGLMVNRTKTKQYLCIGHEAEDLYLEDYGMIGTCKNYTY